MNNFQKEDNNNEFKFKNEIENKQCQMPLWYLKSRHGIYYTLGVLEILIAFRFIFKLLGANPKSGFVVFLYSITNIFIAPFSGIFESFTTNGLSVQSIFEPASIIAMLVYGIIAWGIVKLLRINVLKDNYAK
ncbi:YggT family protein [Herbivorax sp. ANBcel31]|nr:YggT family protein [Herbivorax sp. ANBcel31]MDQ2086972.1 YggT family protein [Herbivorax sp. ANBcel31]